MAKKQAVLKHFQENDEKIYTILNVMPWRDLPTEFHSVNYFEQLAINILSQQLGSKAADAIADRFYKLFPKRNLAPETVMALPLETMRSVGMSWAKARYIQDLARQTVAGTVNLANLHELDDESVITELMKVNGIGKWTAEMFLIFTLGREDVFSEGDLGLRNALKKLYPYKKTYHRITESWKPYRSYASLALWHSLDNR